MNNKELLEIIKHTLEDHKAKKLQTLNLQGKTNIADYFIVATADSTTHASTLADKLIRRLKQEGIKNIHSEGLTFKDWIVIDVQGIIVHIFRQEVRDYYNIEQIWEKHQSNDEN